MPGRWTMDFEAAKKMAKKQKMALFLDFTGSDWCGWCKLMQNVVFSQSGWEEYAKDKLALVTIDFPKEKGLVPEKYVKQNFDLQKKYGVTGYPTYVILDTDGETELGRLGTNRNITFDTFKRQVQNLLRYTTAYAQEFAKTMNPDAAKEYLEAVEKFQKANLELKLWLKSKPENNPENQNKYLQFNQNIILIQGKLESLEAKRIAKSLSPDKAADYLSINTELQNARRELNMWLQSHPMSAENRQKYQQFQAHIDALIAKRESL
jgi:thiol-disulfide isomerase/thioredoxin